MAIFADYRGQCFTLFSALFHPWIANPTSGPLPVCETFRGAQDQLLKLLGKFT